MKMNRRQFVASIGLGALGALGALGLTKAKLLKQHSSKNNAEWINTHRIGKAFDQIEVKSVEMHPYLYNKAKNNETKGTMELPYLIHFDKKCLWKTPIVLNPHIEKYKIYICGTENKIAVTYLV